MGLKAGGFACVAAGLVLLSLVPAGWSKDKAAQDKAAAAAKSGEKVVVEGKPETPAPVPPADSTTDGSVTVGGQAIAYKAVAGMLTDAGVKPLDKDKPEEA